MTIDNALASVAVRNLDKAAAWYAELLGSDGNRPMPEVAEWMFSRGGGLQVYVGAERAGSCSFTLVVSDLDEQIRQLESMGVDTSKRTTSDQVKTVMINDPAGNSIAIAQSLSPNLAR